MKKLVFALLAGCTLLLTSCLETTQEITINEDGSGTLTNTSDMSSLIGIAKQMGGGSQMDQVDKAIDSTFSLAPAADSIANLTDAEKAIIKKGTAKVNIDLKAEKFVTGLVLPFNSLADINATNAVAAKVTAEMMKEQAGKAPGGDQMPAPTSLDDFYTTSYTKGLLVRTVNKEKYATAADDEYLKGMKEAAGMGLNASSTYIINLPRPAKKAEGKNVTLSEDKRKVTIKAGLDDFLEDAAVLEYRIEY